MFQQFEPPLNAGQTAIRVAKIRELMAKRGIDAFLVPRADQFQGEYVPPPAERLRWLTGFSGSAGSAVITRRSAALFVDGRYTVQVRTEADLDIFDILQVPEQKLSDWLKTALPAGAIIGFDPWLHPLAWVETFTAALAEQSMRMKPVAANLVDLAWGRDRPAEPAGQVTIQPLKYAGVSAVDKVGALQKRLKTDRQDAVVLTLPDSICWLLNIRGSDVAHNPVALAFAVVPADGKVELFIDVAKVDDQLRAHLAPVAALCEPEGLSARLQQLAMPQPKVSAGKANKAKDVPRPPRVRLDADTAAFAIARALGKAAIVRGRDPCIEAKARKCTAEIKGTRAAHLRDGVAVTRFLHWLDREGPSGNAKSAVDEITAVRTLEDFRRTSKLLRDISFDTISGSGPNGAIVHYRVTEATNRRLQPGELFLIDSGGQYVDGTTDITRTIAIGKPTDEMRQRYTAVLKGHVAISTVRFPVGTRGVDLDPLARNPLWQLGLDYDHGTGHGVGSFLSVHEGPAGISKRSLVPIEPGMILSNEPGYYKQGDYGIRIENLVLVTAASAIPDGERKMMAFETLTLAPYDRRLIVSAALTTAERDWIDAYHARVLAEIGPALDEAGREWLAKAAAPLS